MSNFNVYAYRALKSKDPIIRQPANVIKGTMGYMDRLLGVSATKMRVRANSMNTAAGMANSPRVSSAANALDSRAKHLTSLSKGTRIKTGIGLGAAVMVNKAMSNYKSQLQDQQYQQYQNYY